MRSVRQLAERTWGRVLGADPGLRRLRSAGRITLTLAVVLLVLLLPTLLTGRPPVCWSVRRSPWPWR